MPGKDFNILIKSFLIPNNVFSISMKFDSQYSLSISKFYERTIIHLLQVSLLFDIEKLIIIHCI